MRTVTEPEFRMVLRSKLMAADLSEVGCVAGPGRSGAVAAVYASHILSVPFIPFGAQVPPLGRLLLVDTARQSGKTLRKAARQYADADPIIVVAFEEPPRVAFWYEAPKPQRYRHETRAARAA